MSRSLPRSASPETNVCARRQQEALGTGRPGPDGWDRGLTCASGADLSAAGGQTSRGRRTRSWIVGLREVLGLPDR